MKVLSAVRYSGKTHWSHELQFVDCDVLVAKAIGWPKHFGKKSNIRGAKNFKCEETDDHEIAKKFSEVSWKVLEQWGLAHDQILSIPEAWSTRSFWKWNVKPDVLVTIDEERHKQNLIKANKGHEWNTIKFWRHMLKHEAEENHIKVVNTFQKAMELLR